MIWFLEDHIRFSQERNAINQLAETADWLVGTDWTINGGLCVNADILVHGKIYQVIMLYPIVFPNAPPIVRPRNSNEYWSSHQYSSGTLCLEWGQDTWHPSVTGSQVLESVHKLLEIENQDNNGQRGIAPSRHQLSIGQTLRNQYCRFFVGEQLTAYLNNLPSNSKGTFEYGILFQSDSYINLIYKIHPIETESWEDKSIPSGMMGNAVQLFNKKGSFYKTNLNSNLIRSIKSTKQIEEILIQNGDNSIKFNSDTEQPPSAIFLIDENNTPHFLYSYEKDVVSFLTPVYGNVYDVKTRIPTEFQKLSEKLVGIVGLGSVGGKIALSLGRTGVTHFRLVDDDIILPENLCRHVLDWRSLGEHKVTAISQALSCISSGINVETSCLNLTGQESTASINGELQRLGKCDLIIDATANPAAFNLLSAVAKTYSKPLIWTEVYAGGIGGFMARSRPNKDLTPHDMKAIYHSHTNQLSPFEFSSTEQYVAEASDGTVIVASDADVSVLAAHVTQLAIDTLLEREPSNFPYSMYLIGLNQAWIFKAPFDTIPIDCRLATKPESATPSPEVVADNMDFLKKVLEDKSNNADTSS